jgi:hypothetical protein
MSTANVKTVRIKPNPAGSVTLNELSGSHHQRLQDRGELEHPQATIAHY